MKTKLHIECFELLNKVTEQYKDVKFEDFKDFGNSLRVSSETFFIQKDDDSFRFHFDVTIHPGHDNFSENYLHVHRTTYVNERSVEFMKDCIDIPCTYIDDEYHDKRSKRHATLIPKETFYDIAKVLKEYKEKHDHVNLVIIHYYLNFKVKL